jgi:hypothetical protein
MCSIWNLHPGSEAIECRLRRSLTVLLSCTMALCLPSGCGTYQQGNTVQASALAGDTVISDMLCGLYANTTLKHHAVSICNPRCAAGTVSACKW